MTSLSLLSLLAYYILTFVVYRLYTAYRLRRATQRHGCKPAKRYDTYGHTFKALNFSARVPYTLSTGKTSKQPSLAILPTRTFNLRVSAT
ncbi:hypothetical protein F5Y16DRAFT_393047 [Xylariaceae sp. FL0255]|nr:hypothetical protein F5Y16DRAFT_393047 [Xylariaceae sp. FL0255]